MKKLLVLTVFLLAFLIAAPVNAAPATLVVDDGADCPEAGYTTIAAALADAADGDTIVVCSGSYDGVLLDKSVEIRGKGRVIIAGGPAHSSGLIQGFRLLAGSDGATISHLHFEGVDLAIMNGAAVNDVTVSHNTFINTIQAISNWLGDSWLIEHNVITDLRTRCGGGIGILIADYSGTDAKNNVVSHNKISGTLQVAPDDCGGYSGTGIVLYADFRGNRAGGYIRYNQVVQNKVSLVSDTPQVVDVVAFELTDTRDEDYPASGHVVTGNKIGFNDFRGTENQIALTPQTLAGLNKISRNLGDNRGHGLHPSSVFSPDGN